MNKVMKDQSRTRLTRSSEVHKFSEEISTKRNILLPEVEVFVEF